MDPRWMATACKRRVLVYRFTWNIPANKSDRNLPSSAGRLKMFMAPGRDAAHLN